MTTTGGELLAATLAAHGVEVAFGLHGGHLDPLLVAARDRGIRLVDARHEAAAVNAADGYARVTGRLGVAFATAGAGFTNCLAGVGVAHADRSPVLVITSSPPGREAETNALQGFLDQPAIAAPMTRFAHRVTSPDEVPRLASLAIREALTGVPGPALLDVPVDVLFGAARGTPEVAAFARVPRPPAPAPGAVEEAVALLRRARRPAVIAGGGLRGPGPSAALAAFAARARVPVFHPGMIVGAMAADDPHYGWSARCLDALVAAGEGPDALLLVGARFGFYLGGRGGGTIPRDAAVVQVDLDGAEIGRVRPADVGIVADATATLTALTAAWGQPSTDRDAWLALATGVHARPSPFADDAEHVKGRLHPYHGVRAVLRALDPGATLVVDGGEIAAWVQACLPQARPHRAIGCGYLGHLGTTPGLAIGAQVAEPDRRVVLLIGDGGAGFHVQEFDTMVRHRLPIVTVVVNNEAWGMSLHGQQLMYGPETEVVTGLDDTAFDRVAAGFGAFGVRVDTLDDVGPAMAAALKHGGPACVNLAVSGEVAHPVTAAMLGTPGSGGTILPYYENVDAS